MQDDVFGYADLAVNLRDKLDHPDFQDDLRGLVTEMPSDYELTQAADLVMERLGSKLDRAPTRDGSADGGWRRGA